MMREREAHLVAMRERSGRKRDRVAGSAIIRMVVGSTITWPPSPQDGLVGSTVTWLRHHLRMALLAPPLPQELFRSRHQELEGVVVEQQSQSQMLIRMDGCFCRWEGCVLEFMERGKVGCVL
uniref:Uncharacterized protein n=1 Tax=Fagus sylvatica TaxID=28930 RepID=A0A2N9EMN3_FAGSY